MSTARNKLEAAFPKGRAALVVVHVQSSRHALAATNIAREAGADGVFLIDHQPRPWTYLHDCYLAVRAEHPDWWVGLNFLGHDVADIFRVAPKDVSGLWADTIVSPNEDEQIVEDNRLAHPALFFGGAAFKGQPLARSLAEEARWAAERCDVVTTSGPRTGEPPDPSKLQVMRNALGPVTPLAIASGMSPENVTPFVPLVDCFLVSTMVTDPKTELPIPSRVEDFVSAVGGD